MCPSDKIDEKIESEGKSLSEKSAVKTNRWGNLPVFAGYLVFSIALLYPVTFHLKSRIWGMLGIEDLQEAFQLFWWWKRYIAYLIHEIYFDSGFNFQNLLPFLNDFFTYPIIQDMGNFFDFFISYLLERFLPFPSWYNLKNLIAFVLNGYCFYLLAKYLFKNRVISFTLGMLFATSPYLFLNFAYGRLEQVFLFPIPVCILYLLKLIDEKQNKMKNAILCGLFLALSSLFYWFYGMFLCFFIVIFIVYTVIKNYKHPSLLKKLAYLLVVGVVFLALISPFIFPYVRHLVFEKKEIQWVKKGASFPELNVDQFNVIKTNTPMILLQSCSVEYPFVPSADQYIPVILTLLVIFSFFLYRKVPLLWYVSLLFFYLLSLGPYIRISGEYTAPPIREHLYTLFFKYVPFFSRFSWPSRIVSFVMLFSCILAGYSMVFLNRKAVKLNKKMKFVLPSVILAIYVLLVYAAGFLPIQVTPFHIPEPYLSLKPGGLIELPFNARSLTDINFYRELEKNKTRIDSWNHFLNARYFYHFEERHRINYYQVFHQRKIFNDTLLVGGEPREKDIVLSVAPFATSNSVINYLINLSADPDYQGDFSRRDLKRLRNLGYRYLVVHESFFKEIVDYIIINWDRCNYSEAIKSFSPARWYCPDLDKMRDLFYVKFREKLEKKFGKPIYTGYEIHWERRTLDNFHMKGRWSDNFVLKKTDLLVFPLKLKFDSKLEAAK